MKNFFAFQIQMTLVLWSHRSCGPFLIALRLSADASVNMLKIIMTCIPQIVIRVCVAMFAKTCHLATLSLIGGYLGQLWP